MKNGHAKYDKRKKKISMAKKKVQIQGAQILSDDTYFSYFEETKDAAQRRSWTFYEAIKMA
ncbi:MAG: hypothetical protein ACKVE4_10705 [Dissulfuribacterales bacterium]